MIANEVLAMMLSGDPKPKPQTPANATQINHSSAPDSDTTLINDLVNYSVAAGTAPLSHDQGKSLYKTAIPVLGQKQAQDLITYLTLFNQRDDVKSLSADDKIKTFYSLPSNNEGIEALKTKLKRIGYGPTQTYHDSPNIDLQKQQSIAKI